MKLGNRLSKIEAQLNEQDKGHVKVWFGAPSTAPEGFSTNPNDTVVYFDIPRPRHN